MQARTRMDNKSEDEDDERNQRHRTCRLAHRKTSLQPPPTRHNSKPWKNVPRTRKSSSWPSSWIKVFKKKHDVFPFREFVAHGHHRLGFPTLQPLLTVQLSMSQILPFRSPFFGCQKPTQQSQTLIGSLYHLVNGNPSFLHPNYQNKRTSPTLVTSLLSMYIHVPPPSLLPFSFEPYLRSSISSFFVQVLISLTNDSLNRTFLPSVAIEYFLPMYLSLYQENLIVNASAQTLPHLHIKLFNSSLMHFIHVLNVLPSSLFSHCLPAWPSTLLSHGYAKQSLFNTAVDLGQRMLQHVVIYARSKCLFLAIESLCTCRRALDFELVLPHQRGASPPLKFRLWQHHCGCGRIQFRLEVVG